MSNEKIHGILEYVCANEAKDAFDSDEIAQALNLSVSEVNTLIREIENNGDAKTISDKLRSQKGIISILKITATIDAYKTMKYMEPKYNLYFNSRTSLSGAFVLFDIPEKKLPIILEAYNLGKSNFTISGHKYVMGDLRTFKIYTAGKSVDEKEFWQYCDANGLLSGGYLGKSYKLECLGLLGKDVTEDFIGDLEYGSQKEQQNEVVLKVEFVNQSRIEELKALNHPDFDFIKLVTLCEELNDNFKRENYFSVGMLGRSILDHIPPIFNQSNFSAVASHHGGSSFKKSMGNLNNSFKQSAHRYLHQPIRNSESLPNATQVDFRQDLDVLLEEVVRKCKPPKSSPGISVDLR